MARKLAMAVRFKREFFGGRDWLRCQLPQREQNRRPPWHNVCLMSIRLGVTRFQAGSSRGLKAAVSAEDAVRNMDNNGGTRARTFTEMA